MNKGPKRDHNFDNHPTDNFGLQRLGVKLWGSVHDPRSPETETHKIENFSVREPYIIRISGLDSSGCKLLDLDVLLTYSSTASTVPKMRRRGFLQPYEVKRASKQSSIYSLSAELLGTGVEGFVPRQDWETHPISPHPHAFDCQFFWLRAFSKPFKTQQVL